MGVRFHRAGGRQEGDWRKRDSRSARRIDWSVRDWARRVVGRGKKRAKRSADENGYRADCGRESTTTRPPGLEQPEGMKHGASPRTG